MNRKPLWVVFALILAASISACGTTSRKVTTPAITVAITTPPPATLTVNGTASIVATVTNDTAAAGVDWTCTPTATCGSFNPAHTDSGAATVFTASATAGAIVITAASVTTPTIAATFNVTVNQPTVLQSIVGPYTFAMNGWTENGPYSVVGNVVLDGSGNITGGEQDAFNFNTSTLFTADAIQAATGAVVIGSDGRGTITLTPTLAPVETLSIAVVNPKHAVITEFDDVATTTGTMDLQTAPTSIPTGRNAFALFDTADYLSYGGVYSSDDSSTITTGEIDANFEFAFDFDDGVTGSYTAPDAAGRGTITLSMPNFEEEDVRVSNNSARPAAKGASTPQTMQFAYYVVGPEVFRLVEIDANFFASGSIYGQGSATYSYNSLGSSFVFGLSGEEDYGIGGYAMAGQFTGDGEGSFTTGVADVNEGAGDPVLAGDLSSSEYFVYSDGYAGFDLADDDTAGLDSFGVYMVDPNLNIADPNSSTGGGGALMIELDDDNNGAGIIVPQTSGATFTGNYAITQDGAYETESTFSFFDLVGQVNSDGTSTFSGLADFNDLLNTGLNPGITVSATYLADEANPGRTTAVVTLAGDIVDNITIYQASSSLLLHVDEDSTGNRLGTVAFGVLEQQQLSQ
jgi:hypothetical protein